MPGLAQTARCEDCGEEAFVVLMEDGSGQSAYCENNRLKWNNPIQCRTCGGNLHRDPPQGESPILIRAEEKV
jgi:hypothetical protein